jgi:hypothetical protein
VDATWPAGIPAGTQLVFQLWQAHTDGFAAVFYKPSNGLRALVP